MANRVPKRGTAYRGHGKTEPRYRFAIKRTGLVRGEPTRSKTAPWFLKTWGSKPIYKRRRLMEAA